MPALSDTMSNGRLVRWVKHEGDAIKRGEAIAEVETDKAVMDVEAFHDGYLCGPLAPTDTDVPVGQTIGYLVDTQAEVGATPPPSKPGLTESAGAPAGNPSPTAETRSSGSPLEPPKAANSEARASPYARTLAQRLGVNLTQTVKASTPIRAADVLAAAEAAELGDLKGGPPYRLERNSSFREATAQVMIASVGTPTFRVTAALPLAGLIARAKKDQQSVNLLLARVCALSITEHPRFNALYTPDGIAWRERIDIAIAVDSPEGLITPVLRNVAKRSLAELSVEWGALLEKARTRRITHADYSGATFYVSDLGVFPSVYSFESIIPRGAAALLSVGAVQGERALCTLNCDHRVVFGGDAARFLETLAKQVVSIAGSGG
jgi:pyruvate dehydrogenase E2 component (dihydrolipoamide acetyltransferase)